MKKDEYIAKYGVEKYNEQKKKIAENTRKRNQRNKENNVVKVLTDVDDSVTGKTFLDAPFAESEEEGLKLIEKKAYAFQKYLQKLWRKETTKPFILVVDEYIKAKGGKRFIAKCNLTQLNMDAETRQHFIEIVKTGSEFFETECRS